MITLEEYKAAVVKYEKANEASLNDIEFGNIVIEGLKRKIAELEAQIPAEAEKTNEG